MKNLISKIENKKAKIGVVGLGYVGLPLLLSFAKKGFPVYGLDTNKKKIDLLKKGKTNLKKYEKLLKKVKKKCRLNFEPNYKKFISSLDIIIICLPTPLKKNNSPDISFIKRCVYKLDKFLRKDQAIILESTSYPGTTREIILPIIKKKKFRIGKDFFLIYSPEREDPTYKNFTINNIPKVISGLTRNCLIVADKIYNKITTTVKVSSLESAEFTKLLVPSPQTDGSDQDKGFISGIFSSFGDAEGGFSEELQEVTYALGAEYLYNNAFALRTGYFHESPDKGNRQFFTVGAGFRMNTLNIDLSYLINSSDVNNPLENSLRFSVSFDLGEIYNDY